jgi:hypothetical protein
MVTNNDEKEQIVPTDVVPTETGNSDIAVEETPPSEEALMDENIDSGKTSENTVPIDDSNILKYFPSIEITDANRAELSDAAEKLAEYDVLKPKFEKMKEQNRVWVSILNDPTDNYALAKTINDCRNGENFWSAAAKYVDFKSIEPTDGEPEYANVQKRLDNLSAMEAQAKQDEEMRAMFAENEQKSGEIVDQFIADKGYTPEQTTQFLDELGDHLDSFYKRTFSPRMLEAIHKNIVWDTEIGNAQEIGKQMGMAEVGNKRISDLQEKEIANETGDGMPDLMGVGMKEKAVRPQSYKEKFLDGII